MTDSPHVSSSWVDWISPSSMFSRQVILMRHRPRVTVSPIVRGCIALHGITIDYRRPTDDGDCGGPKPTSENRVGLPTSRPIRSRWWCAFADSVPRCCTAASMSRVGSNSHWGIQGAGRGSLSHRGGCESSLEMQIPTVVHGTCRSHSPDRQRASSTANLRRAIEAVHQTTGNSRARTLAAARHADSSVWNACDLF